MKKKITTLICLLLVGMMFLFFTSCSIVPVPEKTQKTPGVGDTVTNKAGTLTFVSETESSATFTLIKTTNEKIEFHITGNSVVRSWLDENGKMQYETENFFASTNANAVIGNYVNRSDELIVIVNGDRSVLPVQPGTYEITIDYMALVEKGNYLDSLFQFGPFGWFTRQEEVMWFDELRFTLLSVYTDAVRDRDVVDMQIHVNHWVSAPDKYIQKLYIRSTSSTLTGITAFGRDCETEIINGQTYFVIDATKPNSEYRMDLWLKLFYEKGALMDTELAQPRPTALVALTMYLNKTQSEDACHVIHTLATQNIKSERFEIYATIDAVPDTVRIILPTIFSTDATQVNQIIVYHESGSFYAEYKTENKMESYSVYARNSETVYGDQIKEHYVHNGMTYTKITDEAGYENPPYNIDFYDAESKMYYTICVNVRVNSDWRKIVRGLFPQPISENNLGGDKK